MERSISIPAQVTRQHAIEDKYHTLYEGASDHYRYALRSSAQEVLLQVHLPNTRILFVKLLYLRDSLASCDWVHAGDDRFVLKVNSAIGAFHIRVSLTLNDLLHIQYKVDYRPSAALCGVDTPREVLILHEKGLAIPPKGQVYVQQKQLRSGTCFTDFGKDTPGTLFYFQNLTALNSYAEDTKISLGDSVQVAWPELGFKASNPSALPLQKGKKYGFREGYLIFNPARPENAWEASLQYLSALENVYQRITRPRPTVRPLQRYAIKVLKELDGHHGCWQQVGPHAYLNAYMNDYHNPVESMVQLAVLTPLLLYSHTYPARACQRICTELLQGFPAFFDEKLGCFVRWIPKKAHHFDYTWPVFYDVDTLEAEKKETEPGAGGEKDVGGMYAFLMLRAYKLSKKEIYLSEAKRAAKKLRDYGFDLIYQSNNTAYAAEALLELWTLTKEDIYLQLSELCLGNLIRNTGLWERRYGNSKTYPTFFALFPLPDAPYSAVFEEQECVASFHRFMRMAYDGRAPLSREITVFLPEYIKYASARLPYYFPPLLPEDTLATEVKTGYLHKKAWIPVEDLGDGWEAIGAVGQEVYGAGCLFSLLHFHFLELDSSNHTCFISYPFVIRKRTTRSVTIQVLGSADYFCMLRLCGTKGKPYTLRLADGQHIPLRQTGNPAEPAGDQQLVISWT
ncbi:hypothetical protein G5B30_10355 [Sphingobacterium sp. SGG-5]|uniref:hypothetical protein n=1 Tax=Sphingobacterium sp. SGG-5 TaxID=2710881 RepID=UPI0013EA6C06|nr:hypothetical protein [Sphingobacterium sp. SGG-5]NGM62314.1 hypothetical protein [Sphingobacterium sp. SGG-5]